MVDTCFQYVLLITHYSTKFSNVQNREVSLKIKHLQQQENIKYCLAFLCRYEQVISVQNLALQLQVVAQQMARNFSGGILFATPCNSNLNMAEL